MSEPAKQIKRNRDAMAKFLIKICEYSDRFSNNYRSAEAEKHYKEARRLIRQAGYKFQEPRP